MENTADGLVRNSDIFVGIPSFRDPAKNPEKIFVGICWQFDEEKDTDCFQIPYPRPDQVREIKISCKKSQGPCLARHYTQSLWKGEEHMRFIENWDTHLIELLEKCGYPTKNEVILTTYPAGYELPNKIPSDKRSTAIVADRFGPEGMLRYKGKLLNKVLSKPIPSMFWVSGYAFSSSKVITQVPYDPHLPFLFFGEEQLMNVRLWTNGWRFYTPPYSIVFHLWDRSYRPTYDKEVDQDLKNLLRDFSLARVNLYFGIGSFQDLSTKFSKKHDQLDEILTTFSEIHQNYGLGTLFMLEEYEKEIGIRFEKKEIDSNAKLGGFNANDFADFILEQLLMLSSQIK